MISVTFTGLRDRLLSLDRLEREQLPFAAALALTKTAEEIKKQLQAEMREVFDRPTRYTINSLFLEAATKDRMQARVWIKDRVQDGNGRPAVEWLAPEVYGGPRSERRSERLLNDAGVLPEGRYVVPGKGAKLDAYGNISRGTMQKIISGLGAQQDRLQNSTNTVKRTRYFVFHDGQRTPIGIAERTGKGKENLRMVLAFVRRPSYDRKLDFFGVADRVASDQLPIQFEVALARAIATRRR